jgi:hypothetical protein
MVISMAVVVINPYTWQMWFYPFQTVGIGALRDYIQEWRSPDFHLLFVQPFVVMLLLTLGALARAGRRADWTDLALVAMWAWWGLFAARNIAIFGLVVTPVLVRYADIAWLNQWQSWGYKQDPPFSRQAMSGPATNQIWPELVIVGSGFGCGPGENFGAPDPGSKPESGASLSSGCSGRVYSC